MGFLKTPEEIQKIQQVIANPRFTNCEMLMVGFLTRPETVRSVLPPGVQPSDEPAMAAMVGRWQSNCVGDFQGGALYVSAKYQGRKVTYILAMYVSTDSALIFGREVLGEPKKLATTDFISSGNRVSGFIERKGARLIDIGADLNTDLSTDKPLKITNLNIKAVPAADGSGLQGDAVATLTELDGRLTTYRAGEGMVVLGGTEHDPLGEIEVLSTSGALYLKGDLIGKAHAAGTIPGDEFLPYFYARQDVWPSLASAAVLDN